MFCEWMCSSERAISSARAIGRLAMLMRSVSDPSWTLQHYAALPDDVVFLKTFANTFYTSLIVTLASLLLWLVLRDGLRSVLLGVVVGIMGATGVARAMQALLYGLPPVDVVSFGTSAALMLLASGVAAVIPARRAVGIDPLRSLRSE